MITHEQTRMARIRRLVADEFDLARPRKSFGLDRPRELCASGWLIFGAPSYPCGAPNDLNVPCSAPSRYDRFSAAMLKKKSWRLPRTGG